VQDGRRGYPPDPEVVGDVVEQGREPRGNELTNRQRVVVLVLVVLAAVFLLSRSGLLSADPPEGRRGDPRPAAEPEPELRGQLVARLDDRLVRLGTYAGPDARLPAGFPSDEPLVHVPAARGPDSLVGVHRGVLFRVPARGSAPATNIGRAERVVAATGAPGRAVVLRGGSVAEVDVATGRDTQPRPFPGFDRDQGWFPEGTVSAVGTRALLMSRPVPGAAGQELALAWPQRRVEAGSAPSVRPLGTYGRLLGIAADWVLTESGDCPGPGCRILVVTVTRDDVRARAVAPPPGWEFGVRAPGGTTASLVPVVRSDDPDVLALARPVAGGDNALLVQGSVGLDPGAGVIGRMGGSVFFVTGGGSGARRVSVWDPGGRGPATAIPGLGGLLPETARLVCVCG
jgi:hypothetical protein